MKVDYLPFTELLSDIIDNRGRTCPTVENGIPLIATNCITNDLLYPAYEKVRYISQEIYDTWFRGHPKPGDLIFVTKGTPGRVCMAPNPIDFCIAQDMVAVRADNAKVYPKYLFAVLRANEIQNQIENMHVGTLIPHFKKSDFDKLLLPVPNRETQEVIGDMYFDFSTKIELNRRMNRTLESLARAFFKELMKDVEEQSSILEIADLLSGGTPSTAEESYWNGDIEWVSAKDISNANGIFLLETEKKITQNGVENSSTKVLPAKTVIVTARGTVGAHCILAKPMAMNQTNYGLKAKSGVGDYFVYFTLSEMVEQLKQQSYGTIFDTITTKTFQNALCSRPSNELIIKIEEQISPIMDAILHYENESRTLAELRDALLPKLMRGEVRVKA